MYHMPVRVVLKLSYLISREQRVDFFSFDALSRYGYGFYTHIGRYWCMENLNSFVPVACESSWKIGEVAELVDAVSVVDTGSSRLSLLHQKRLGSIIPGSSPGFSTVFSFYY